ncbi:MobA/MobL family protein [Sphingomonas endophytica]|uniref:MobA/MobL protein domain-containing protein n=1 Tax=Sphingomonas endophytica TaxID=869719 RepID=A0A147HZE2_9SPHN|nr:MobA/MobL family protein [Sphingomonas endophytica]KTT70412.1 hypothetical protein NS334_12380 [Sphingomonas endophytica]
MMVDGTWIAEGDRVVKRALRQDRGVERKRIREEKQKKATRLHAACEDACTARRLARELAEWEIRHRRWGASVTVHGEPKKQAGGSKKLARLASPSRRRSEPSYFTVRDSQGRIGIYIRGDYVRAGGKGGKHGCAADGFFYTIRDGAALTDAEGNALIISNLGKDAAEIATAWMAVEAVARATRANAKIQFRFVLALDADASEAEMIDAVRRFGEIFEALGLPYSAVIHKPDPGGDDRNWHAHFLTSYRPAEQVAPGEWRFADDLVTALDGTEGMRTLRHLWAHAQTGAARRAGRDVEYTGLSHAARGLDLEAQTHLGPALSDLVARGQHVPAHARNQQVAARNAERLRRRDLEQQRAALHKIRQAVLEQWATRSAREAAMGTTAFPEPVAAATRRSPASPVRVVEPFNVPPTVRERVPLSALPPPPRMARFGALEVRSVPAQTPMTPRRPATVTTLPATLSTPLPAARTAATMAPPVIVSPTSPRLAATLRRLDVPPTAVRASAVIHPTASSPAVTGRDATLVFDTPAQRGRQPREPADLFDMPYIAAVPRAAAAIRRLPAPASDEPIPAWWERVEHYLAWLAWREREDERARTRLGGYAVLPPAYRAAVEAVERDPQLIVEEQAHPRVRAGVPRDLAAQIEAVAGDPHWREFLRRVRAVALEREARATRPIPPVLDNDDAGSSPAGHSTSPVRDPRGPARQRVRGLRPRRS